MIRVAAASGVFGACRWLFVSRASCPRFEGGTPATRRGQDGRDTTIGKLTLAAATRMEYEEFNCSPYESLTCCMKGGS
jgi:hypothetical protein